MRSRIAVILAVILLASPLASTAGEREPGLLVRFYQIGHGMQQMPDLVPDQLPNAVKLIPTLELRTDHGDFAPFEGNFYTEAEGFITVNQSGMYTFRLISDDGSMLWIDDRLVVNHDGPHGAVPKDGEIELTAGDHTLRVAHFESGGEEHLELQWRPPGAESDRFTLIPAATLTHDKNVSRETSPGNKRIIPPLRRGLPGDGTAVAGIHPTLAQRSEWPMGYQGHADDRMRVLCDAPNEPPRGTVAWYIPDQTGCSLTYEFAFDTAPYHKQILVGNGVAGDIKRFFLDLADDEHQGCAFRFSSGLPAGLNRILLGNDGSLIVGKFIRPEGQMPGLDPVDGCVLISTGEPAFEMLAVRAMTNGFEIEFTKPLDPRCGWEPEAYYVEQWPFRMPSDEATERRSDEGHAPRRDGVRYPVKSASVSADRKRVFLEIENLKPSHVVYIRLLPPCYSEDGERPWSTEAWYTLNVIPQERYGEALAPPKPEPQNFLTAEEKAAGWKLLFDGKTTKGWRGYRKDHMPDGWQVKDQCLVRVGPGGDIITEGEFDNCELQIEWRICAAGNSGIFYRVNEDFDWPFFTGPEFQVLDNAEHADGRSPLTSAGSNYALHAPVRDVTAPVGFFNQARIVCEGPHVEHWLNGVKTVEYELWTDEWKQMVAGTKFKAWPNYGLMKKGHVVLQDHGDMVWYRNVKVRALGTK